MTAAQMIYDQMADYNRLYRPQEDKVIADLGSNALIDEARATLRSTDQTQAYDRGIRNMRRYGGAAPTALQRDVAAKQIGLRTATSGVNTMNNAMMSQYERNTGLRDKMIDVGRDLQGQASSGIMDAARGDSMRKQTNMMNKAQDKANMTSTAATLGTVALAFM